MSEHTAAEDAPCFARGVDPEGNPWCALLADHDGPHSDPLPAAEKDAVRSVNDPRFHQGSYDLGHEEGERCRDADYDFAITEFTDWPDDVEVTPQAVAERLRSLEAAVGAPRPLPPGEGRA